MSDRIKAIDIIEEPTTGLEHSGQPPLSRPPPSVHITCYAYGGMSSAVLNSWIDLANHLAQRTRYAALRTIREDALISRSRCRATSFFLQDDKDVWIQLDHDIQFDTQDLMRLADLAHKHQAAICMPYSCRALPPRPAHRPKPDSKPLDEEPTLTPISYFASGALAIPRQALENALTILSQDVTPEPFRIQWCSDTMTNSFPTLWMPFAMECSKGREYLSEDYAASARLQLMGIPQLVYQPKVNVQHWGEFNFHLEPAKDQIQPSLRRSIEPNA